LTKKKISANLLIEQYHIFKDLLTRNEDEKDKIKEEDKIRFPFIVIEFPDNKKKENTVKYIYFV
jgi:hypothetical protein